MKKLLKSKNKLISLMLVLAMLASVGLTACGDSAANSDVTEETVNTDESAATEESAAAEEDDYVDKMDRSDEGFTLIWNDEFDGDALDSTKWTYMYGTGDQYGLDGWGNSEQQYYTDREENLKVEDGKLKITAIKEEKSYEGMPYTSARIRTMANDEEALFAAKYGRIEARIKMPIGEGLWPAFWMLPVDPALYNQWASSGEIDIMEARGRLPQQVGGTLHYGKTWPNNVYEGTDYVFEEGTDISDFHVYSLEWDPEEFRWYVDDELYFTLDKWYGQGKGCAEEYTWPAPFDVPFYILLNMAVGGTFDSEANLDNAEFPATMEVDFVRVYEKDGGYEPVSVKEEKDDRNTVAFEEYASSYTDGEFIVDQAFETMNTEAITDTDKGIVADSKDWHFAVGNFGGAATACVEEIDGTNYANINVTNGGSQTYSVQLIQHFPAVQGYTYEITFDAKGDNNQSIVASPSGDGDNSWMKYASFGASLTEEIQTFTYTFKMNAASDPTARLEFNLGSNTGNIWIGNVHVKLGDENVDPNKAKTPLYGGNLIYNGTFDQGTARLVYWNLEGMDAVVPDFVVDESGEEDYGRMVELTATGESPSIYQTGIQVLAQKNYLLTLELKGEADVPVTVELTNADGSVKHLSEVCEYKAADGVKTVEIEFVGPESDETDGIFKISVPAGSKINLDNIVIKKVLK